MPLSQADKGLGWCWGAIKAWGLTEPLPDANTGVGQCREFVKANRAPAPRPEPDTDRGRCRGFVSAKPTPAPLPVGGTDCGRCWGVVKATPTRAPLPHADTGCRKHGRHQQHARVGKGRLLWHRCVRKPGPVDARLLRKAPEAAPWSGSLSWNMLELQQCLSYLLLWRRVAALISFSLWGYASPDFAWCCCSLPFQKDRVPPSSGIPQCQRLRFSWFSGFTLCVGLTYFVVDFPDFKMSQRGHACHEKWTSLKKRAGKSGPLEETPPGTPFRARLPSKTEDRAVL